MLYNSEFFVNFWCELYKNLYPQMIQQSKIYGILSETCISKLLSYIRKKYEDDLVCIG